MNSGHPLNAHCLTIWRNAQAALTGPESVAIGVDFWGAPSLRLAREAVPRIGGVIRTRVVYANLADAEQSGGILRAAVHCARAPRLRARSAFQRHDALPTPRPAVWVHYVWVDIDWLEAALRSLADLSVPLGAPDLDFRETYSLGIWRTDITSMQACWGVGTPGAFEALSARCDGLWAQMTDLLRRGEPVAPQEHWPLDTAPEYEQVPAGFGGPDGDDPCATCDRRGSAATRWCSAVYGAGTT